MSEQTINEIIKALAYGKTPEQIADVEDISVEEVQAIAEFRADDVEEEHQILMKAGYLS